MIRLDIEIDDVSKSFSFPNTWEEITISQYRKIHSINKPEGNSLEYIFNIIHALTNVDMELLTQISYTDFKMLMEELNFLFQPVKNTQVEFITIDGENYYLYTDFNKYTAGEIISIDTILQRNQHDYISCIEELLCIFLRKKIDGKIEKFNTDLFHRKTMFENCKITEVNNIFSFFLSGKSSLETNTKDYSKKTPQSKKASLRKD